MAERVPISKLNESLADLEIETHISTGGQKAVYKAKTPEGKTVVVKSLPVESESGIRRAQREIEAMNRIENPILVELIDAFNKEIDGDLYFILVEEYIPGKTLQAIIDGGGYGVNLGIIVIRSLLEVLCEFDEENIVHRDIKPANIIITPEAKVRLLDVGIARFLTKSTLTPSFLPHAPGTYPYSAPEQLENQKDLQDTRTDLFSSGIVMYEAITGTHPFDVHGMSIPRAILAGERRELNLRGVDEGLNEKLVGIFDKLTRLEPYQRYRKPQFALEELEQIDITENHA